MIGRHRGAFGYDVAAAAANARWGVDAIEEPLAQAAKRGDILYVLTHHVGPFFWLRVRLQVKEKEIAPLYLIGESGGVALHDDKTAFAQILADAQPDVRENSAAIASAKTAVFKPGSYQGKPVPVRMVIPLEFLIHE